MEALLGIDLGTSSVKVVVASLSGQQLGVGTAEYPIQTPAPGWAVQDPEQWWNATCQASHQAIQMAGNTKILGVGFSGQMHGPLLLDTKRRPIGGAIIWADQRGGAVLGDIQDRIETSVLAQRCGTAPAAGFLITTLFWLQRFQPETLRAADIALLPKDYVRFRLTGEIGSDPSDAAATGLFDISEGAWAWDLIEKLELPARVFPSLLPSAAMAGRLTPEAAAALGLDAGTPVATGSADQPAQASANGLFDPGLSSITLGTGGQVFVPLDQPLTDALGRLHTFNHAIPQRWYLLGAMLSAGMALRWFKELWEQPDLTYRQLDQFAAEIPPGSEGLFFLPYLVGERAPLMDPHARGAFVGLTLRHRRGHYTRAVLEGIGFALRQIVETMQGCGAEVNRLVASGNGLAGAFWRQMVADILNRPLLRGNDTHSAERAGIGAAMLGGLAAGAIKDLTEAKKWAPKFDQVTTPDPTRAEEYNKIYERFIDIYPRLKSWFR